MEQYQCQICGIKFHSSLGRIKVQLTKEQRDFARYVASWRNAGRDKMEGRNGAPSEDSGDHHLLGALGALAASVAVGVPWNHPVDDFGETPQVGTRTDVCTRPAHAMYDPDLTIRRKLRPERLYVLMLQSGPDFWYCGWIEGSAVQVGVNAYYGAPPNGRGSAIWVPECSLTR